MNSYRGGGSDTSLLDVALNNANWYAHPTYRDPRQQFYPDDAGRGADCHDAS